MNPPLGGPNEFCMDSAGAGAAPESVVTAGLATVGGELDGGAAGGAVAVAGTRGAAAVVGGILDRGAEGDAVAAGGTFGVADAVAVAGRCFFLRWVGEGMSAIGLNSALTGLGVTAGPAPDPSGNALGSTSAGRTLTECGA